MKFCNGPKLHPLPLYIASEGRIWTQKDDDDPASKAKKALPGIFMIILNLRHFCQSGSILLGWNGQAANLLVYRCKTL